VRNLHARLRADDVGIVPNEAAITLVGAAATSWV